MKTKSVLIFAAFFLLLSAGILAFLISGGSENELPQYTTEINRLLIRLENEWDAPSFPQEVFDYAVIDAEGGLIYASRSGISTTLSAATGHYDIIRDIEKGGRVVGRLIVHDPYEDIRRSGSRRSAVMFGGASLLMLAVAAGYFIYLKKRVVEPFGKLEGFAEKIAAGDLETPLEMDRGNIFGAFTESFDIMREELKASRRREEAALKSRKEMIAELSHDIKTPVASIKAMTDFLELTTESEDQKQTLASINSKADQIDKLVSDLFHATLEELEQLAVSPDELASSELRRIIGESDHLKKAVAVDIKDCVIIADRLRLEQTVGNIISNSYKYADTEIAVTSRFEGSSFLVEFSDKGGGVPEGEIELVTEKFRRGSNAEGKAGSGLGLYISGYFMEKMGGELVCRNNGEGFTVELRFRLA